MQRDDEVKKNDAFQLNNGFDEGYVLFGNNASDFSYRSKSRRTSLMRRARQLRATAIPKRATKAESLRVGEATSDNAIDRLQEQGETYMVNPMRHNLSDQNSNLERLEKVAEGSNINEGNALKSGKRAEPTKAAKKYTGSTGTSRITEGMHEEIDDQKALGEFFTEQISHEAYGKADNEVSDGHVSNDGLDIPIFDEEMVGNIFDEPGFF